MGGEGDDIGSEPSALTVADICISGLCASGKPNLETKGANGVRSKGTVKGAGKQTEKLMGTVRSWKRERRMER